MAKEYSYLSKQHDIALFELEKPIIFTEEVCGYILPACLPKNRPSLGDYGLARTKFTVIGFGISSVNRKLAEISQINFNMNVLCRHTVKLVNERKR